MRLQPVRLALPGTGILLLVLAPRPVSSQCTTAPTCHPFGPERRCIKALLFPATATASSTTLTFSAPANSATFGVVGTTLVLVCRNTLSSVTAGQMYACELRCLRNAGGGLFTGLPAELMDFSIETESSRTGEPTDARPGSASPGRASPAPP